MGKLFFSKNIMKKFKKQKIKKKKKNINISIFYTSKSFTILKQTNCTCKPHIMLIWNFNFEI